MSVKELKDSMVDLLDHVSDQVLLEQMFGVMQKMAVGNLDETGLWNEPTQDEQQELDERKYSTSHTPWRRVVQEIGESNYEYEENFSPHETISQYVSERWTKLQKIFEEKFSAHQAAFEGIDLDTVQKSTGFVVRFCLATTPEKITLDFTDDASVVITARYPNQKDAYLEMYYEPGAPEPVQHIVLISENKVNTFAYDGAYLPALEAFSKAITSSESQVPC